jgi:hypothetical protein
MSSTVPSFSLSRLRPTFGLAWHWINRPSYHVKVRHQFDLGGFEVNDAPSIDLDPMGLQWMRTMELSSRDAGIKYRMVSFRRLGRDPAWFPRAVAGHVEKNVRELRREPTRTCCATPAATRWPTRGTTPGRSRAGSDIARSLAPRSTRRWRRTVSTIFGGIEPSWEGIKKTGFDLLSLRDRSNWPFLLAILLV